MWLYEGKELTNEAVTEKYVGFVYIITNKLNGKRYIGKKLFSTTRRTKVKGKTRRKKVTKQSDWVTYFGSNDRLIADVKEYGEENFKREILKLCKTKGTCNYWEAKLQMQYNVLESDDFYNDHIWVRVHRSHIKL